MFAFLRRILTILIQIIITYTCYKMVEGVTCKANQKATFFAALRNNVLNYCLFDFCLILSQFLCLFSMYMSVEYYLYKTDKSIHLHTREMHDKKCSLLTGTGSQRSWRPLLQRAGALLFIFALPFLLFTLALVFQRIGMNGASQRTWPRCLQPQGQGFFLPPWNKRLSSPGTGNWMWKSGQKYRKIMLC